MAVVIKGLCSLMNADLQESVIGIKNINRFLLFVYFCFIRLDVWRIPCIRHNSCFISKPWLTHSFRTKVTRENEYQPVFSESLHTPCSYISRWFPGWGQSPAPGPVRTGGLGAVLLVLLEWINKWWVTIWEESEPSLSWVMSQPAHLFS